MIDEIVLQVPTFRNLIFEGGSLKCCAHIGCIKYLESIGKAKFINTYIGTSSGAIIAFFCCLGYSATQMESFLKEYIQAQNATDIDIDNIINVFYTLGFDDGNTLETFLRKHLQNYFGEDRISFIEFTKQLGVHFVTCAARLDDLEPTFFSVNETPDVDVIDAILASMAVPVLFKPKLINDYYYIDGAFVNNFPFDYIARNFDVQDSLGVRFTREVTVKPHTHNDMNILLMFATICKNVLKKMNQHKGLPNKNIMTIDIDVSQYLSKNDSLELFFNVHELKFEISDEAIEGLIQSGVEAAKRAFESRFPA
jgi:predicted acylesterase/phospholipase RssA